jgi:hypothetical protein
LAGPVIGRHHTGHSRHPGTARDASWISAPRYRQIDSRYDIPHGEIYRSANRHGISDPDIEHAVRHAVVAADGDESKVLYLGTDRAGNLLEVVTVLRYDRTEVAIHAMPMQRRYEALLREVGDPGD